MQELQGFISNTLLGFERPDGELSGFAEIGLILGENTYSATDGKVKRACEYRTTRFFAPADALRALADDLRRVADALDAAEARVNLAPEAQS